MAPSACKVSGVIQITGAGTVQSTVDITTGAAGFGTLAVETGSVALTNDALLEFASGQIGTIDGFLELNGANARIADAGPWQPTGFRRKFPWCASSTRGSGMAYHASE
jgi:hypothetical protein